MKTYPGMFPDRCSYPETFGCVRRRDVALARLRFRSRAGWKLCVSDMCRRELVSAQSCVHDAFVYLCQV